MKFAYDIIKKPIITERSMMGTQDHKYTFEVAADRGQDRDQEGCGRDLRR